MGINLNSYEEAKEMCQKFVDNEDFSENVRMIASLNFTLVSVCEELNNINKNLEKIANNTEKVYTTGYMRTELNKGEFYGPIKKEFEPSKIGAPYYEGYQVYCDTNTNQNKDSYVDKNIILD